MEGEAAEYIHEQIKILAQLKAKTIDKSNKSSSSSSSRESVSKIPAAAKRPLTKKNSADSLTKETVKDYMNKINSQDYRTKPGAKKKSTKTGSKEYISNKEYVASKRNNNLT
jgi:hypothetical protein